MFKLKNCTRYQRAKAAFDFVVSKSVVWRACNIAFVQIPCEYLGDDVLGIEFDCPSFASFMLKKIKRYRPCSWCVGSGRVSIYF